MLLDVFEVFDDCVYESNRDAYLPLYGFVPHVFFQDWHHQKVSDDVNR